MCVCGRDKNEMKPMCVTDASILHKEIVRADFKVVGLWDGEGLFFNAMFSVLHNVVL